MKTRKLFCEYGPLCYRISVIKECSLRDLADLSSGQRFAKDKSDQLLPVIVKGHMSLLARMLDGVDMTLQERKATNLRLAAAKVSGIIIHPGEVFSFWHAVGTCTKRKGYQEGLTITRGKLGMGVGGGLCQLANLIHYLVLHSPLEVVELHHHTDAIFPDSERRVPFGTGTSISYKSSDYRFQNNTPQDVQLILWLDNTYLYGELRVMTPYNFKYRLLEEDHYFSQEQDEYYRNSKVYRLVTDTENHETIKELILINRSKVLYDPALIPPEELIKQ